MNAIAYRAIYTYAWDLAETGVAAAVDEFKALGLNTVTIAGSYHAGKFLRPHGKAGKVYFPEDGTAYFKTTASRYGTIKPVANSLLEERDVLRELCDKKGIATNVWLVLLHNTLLGTRHPEVTVANAFGDRYVYSLCPSHPESRAYAVGLARDVTQSYQVSGISMESPGFAPYAHGYHHEFALNQPNRWLDNQLGLCFCDHCVKGATAAGINAKTLKARVARDISDYLASDIDFPADMAEAFWLADTRLDGELKAFLDWRCGIVTSLVAEIRSEVRKDATVAVIPSVARPTGGAWYEGSDLAALAKVSDFVEACFYEPGSMRVKADLFDVKRRLGGSQKLRGILRPAWPDLQTKGDFLAAVEALVDGGIQGLAFYNWGHLRAANVAWIADAMKIAERRS
ncbi:MAG: hypothetical protein ACKVP5_20410 [Aestuariivirga sp.]